MQISETQLIGNKCWYVAKSTIFRFGFGGAKLNPENIGTILQSVPETNAFLVPGGPQLTESVSRTVFELAQEHTRKIGQRLVQIRTGIEMLEIAGGGVDDIWNQFPAIMFPAFVSLQQQFEGNFDGFKEYLAQLYGLSPQELHFPYEDLLSKIYKLTRYTDERKDEFGRSINELAQKLRKKPETISDLLRIVVEIASEINNLASILVSPKQRVLILKEFERMIEDNTDFRAIYESCNGNYDLLENLLSVPCIMNESVGS